MNRRRIGLLLLTALFIIALSYSGALGDWAETVIPVRVNAAEISLNNLTTRPDTTVGIELFEERTTKNSDDAVSLAILGQIYAQQAWETDDVALYLKAIDTQREALRLLPGYEPAEISLSASLLATHQFEEAFNLAQAIYEENPKRTDALATAGDSALGLGRYETATAIYIQLQDESPSPLVQVRIAQLAELNGEPQKAIAIMQRATKQALEAGQESSQVAWYLFRLGDLYFDVGRFEEAGQYLEAALRLRPDYAAALTVLAEIEVANGRFEEAIAINEQILEKGGSIGTLAALGDLYTLINDEAKAQIYYQAIETSFADLVKENPAIYGREMASYYADHDLNLNQALALINADLARRQDVQGYETAAWIYFKLGELDKAGEMMDQALQLGSEDASMLYHAGMIAQARGETAEAIDYLSKALETNPAFDPVQVKLAEQTLASLQS